MADAGWSQRIRRSTDEDRGARLLRILQQGVFMLNCNTATALSVGAMFAAQQIVAAGPENAAAARDGIIAMIDSYTMQLVLQDDEGPSA